MTPCETVHQRYDGIANGAVQVGALPEWMRIRGKVAWYVAQGPLNGLGDHWQTFHQKVAAAKAGTPHGPPGDVFICDPTDHEADGQKRLLTILYVPLE